MQNRTGIIRKLDEVGRIVIPKEIRRYLKLQEGSPLEIGINDSGEVVLKAMDSDELRDILDIVGQNLHITLNKNIIFVAGNEVVACYGEQTKGQVSASVINIMNEDKIYYACLSDKTTILPIFSSRNEIYGCQVIIPFRINERLMCMVVYGEQESMDLAEVKFLEFATKLISGWSR